MTLFTSKREQRLWVWTLVVVVAIYSTLALTATLVNTLLDRGQFDGVFVFAFIVVLVAILTQGLKARPHGIEIGIGFGVAAVYMMVFARMGIPRAHTSL